MSSKDDVSPFIALMFIIGAICTMYHVWLPLVLTTIYSTVALGMFLYFFWMLSQVEGISVYFVLMVVGICMCIGSHSISGVDYSSTYM
jgi:hypothetical protein